jgi:hypothetical protein
LLLLLLLLMSLPLLAILFNSLLSVGNDDDDVIDNGLWSSLTINGLLPLLLGVLLLLYCNVRDDGS